MSDKKPVNPKVFSLYLISRFLRANSDEELKNMYDKLYKDNQSLKLHKKTTNNMDEIDKPKDIKEAFERIEILQKWYKFFRYNHSFREKVKTYKQGLEKLNEELSIERKSLTEDDIEKALSDKDPLKINRQRYLAQLQRKLPSMLYDLNCKDVLGVYKRDYDMSDLFEETSIELYSIKPIKDESEKKESELDTLIDSMQKKETRMASFNNSKDEIVTILFDDRIEYTNAFGAVNYLNRYHVTVFNPKSKKTREFSILSIIETEKINSDQEYRKAIEELLSEDNINESNASGYVGVIAKSEGEIGTETKSAVEYRYQTTENYSLVYTAEDVTAARVISKRKLDENRRNNR